MEPRSSRAAHSPRRNTARERFEFGARRAGDVITFKIESKSSGFDRPVTEHFKDQVLAKLAGAGIASLTVTIKRGPHRELVLDFDGADEDVERAKAAFAKA